MKSGQRSRWTEKCIGYFPKLRAIAAHRVTAVVRFGPVRENERHFDVLQCNRHIQQCLIVDIHVNDCGVNVPLQ